MGAACAGHVSSPVGGLGGLMLGQVQDPVPEARGLKGRAVPGALQGP